MKELFQALQHPFDLHKWNDTASSNNNGDSADSGADSGDSCTPEVPLPTVSDVVAGLQKQPAHADKSIQTSCGGQ